MKELAASLISEGTKLVAICFTVVTNRTYLLPNGQGNYIRLMHRDRDLDSRTHDVLTERLPTADKRRYALKHQLR
jgi:hypothetical protein